MAVTNLNASGWTAIVITADGILQARNGQAEIASSASPAANDFISVPTGGSMPVVAGTLYGRGVGFVVTL